MTQLPAVGVSEGFELHRRDAIHLFARMIDHQLERWMDDGRIEPREIGLLTVILVGGVSEALVEHLSTPRPQRRSLEALVDEVTRVWLLVLGVDG